MLDLEARGMAPVVNTFTGDVLDGAWTDCQSTYPSGNGQGGTDFRFSFDVLPGDVLSNGHVNGLDAQLINQRVGTTAGGGGYTIFRDIDGEG